MKGLYLLLLLFVVSCKKESASSTVIHDRGALFISNSSNDWKIKVNSTTNFMDVSVANQHGQVMSFSSYADSPENTTVIFRISSENDFEVYDYNGKREATNSN